MSTVTALKMPSVKGRVTAEEWQARVDLACAYRLVAHHGWTHTIYNHISMRVPGEPGHFLINPLGYHYEELTASSLVKIDHDAKVVDGTNREVIQAGFVIHSAIHDARPDVQCVLHTHTEAGMGVSAQACGLLPLSMSACTFYNRIAYHDYEGITLDTEEQPRLVANLGPNHRAMILRNHGLLTCGRTIGEAFVLMYELEKACRSQIMAQAGGKLVVAPHEVAEKSATQSSRNNLGDRPWPAFVRMMDRRDPSYRD